MNSKVRKSYLLLSLFANLSILFFFKYFNFFVENWNDVAHSIGWNLELNVLKMILPIGLSFHTFQSMAYIFEVYYGRYRAERDLLVYSIYVLYFPQLVAGPIERPQNLIHQFKEHHVFSEARSVGGLYLIAQGLFKKVVVADTLALLVTRVFNQPHLFGFLATALGVLFFTIQIYCDFSGYSDIARGSSQILGIDLMVNFKKPYFSRSISEFWKRWHISLSTWFRDYLYIPLGGNQKGWFRTQFNLLLVFLVSGFWHGANWTFVIWGALHGIYLLIENLVLKKKRIEAWSPWLARIYVFLLVSFTWIFFRAKSLDEAKAVISGLIRAPHLGLDLLPGHLVFEALFLILVLLLIEWMDERKSIWDQIRDSVPLQRWSIYFLLVWVFLLFAQVGGAQFIYFQF